MINENADQSWAVMLDCVAEHGASNEAAALIEDFIDRYADTFATRIEEQAWLEHPFAELVAQAHRPNQVSCTRHPLIDGVVGGPV